MSNFLKYIPEHKEQLKIGLLYLLLIAGGFWHILDVLQTVMTVSAGYFLIILNIWIFWEIWVSSTRETKKDQSGNVNPPARRTYLAAWSAAVVVLTFLIEAIGVKTGLIFGEYVYGSVLKPAISQVPLAIGFAWMGMLFSSTSVTQRFILNHYSLKPVGAAAVVALCMVLFDFMMEPAAVKLNYWDWEGATIPVQNYLAWFLISLVLAWSGFRLKVLSARMPRFAFHAYFGQIFYFLLVWIS